MKITISPSELNDSGFATTNKVLELVGELPQGIRVERMGSRGYGYRGRFTLKGFQIQYYSTDYRTTSKRVMIKKGELDIDAIKVKVQEAFKEYSKLKEEEAELAQAENALKKKSQELSVELFGSDFGSAWCENYSADITNNKFQVEIKLDVGVEKLKGLLEYLKNNLAN